VEAQLWRRISVGWLLATTLALPGCDRASEGSPGTATAGEEPGQELGAPGTVIRASQSGHYRVELRPEDPAADRASIHSWLVRIEDRAGAAIRPSRIAFSGGMPQHAHGFQTAPRVTDALDEGWFRISGIRFHMSGEWTLRVEFVAPGGPDVAIFEIAVPH
jgi:hypothetical protein